MIEYRSVPLAVSCSSADEAWRDAREGVKKIAYGQIVPSRAGDTLEALHARVTITDPISRFVHTRTPPISPGYMAAELVWTMLGMERSDFINDWNPLLPKYAGDGSRYHGAYGKRIRSSLGFDQLERAYQALRSNPSSRQVVIQIWSSWDDMPDHYGLPVSEDVPCSVLIMLKVRNGKLHWSQIMRSSDLDLGFPYDCFTFTYMQEILAGWLELELGSWTLYADSLHLYADSKVLVDEKIFSSTSTAPQEFVRPWRLGYEDTQRVFDVAFGHMDRSRFLLPEQYGEQARQQMENVIRDGGPLQDVTVIALMYQFRKKGYRPVVEYGIEMLKDNRWRRLWRRWEESRANG